MDTSKEYIKMCEEASEIQLLWKHSIRNSGDWYYNKKLDKAYVVSEEDQEDHQCIWLPTQDQIQKLIHIKWTHNFTLLSHYCSRFTLDEMGYITTFEKCWLVIAMVELHNKTWDVKKEKWITQ
jgi:hypothetical protein